MQANVGIQNEVAQNASFPATQERVELDEATLNLIGNLEAIQGYQQRTEPLAMAHHSSMTTQPNSQSYLQQNPTLSYQAPLVPSTATSVPPNPQTDEAPWPPPIEDAEFDWCATPQQERNAILLRMDLMMYVDFMRNAHHLPA